MSEITLQQQKATSPPVAPNHRPVRRLRPRVRLLVAAGLVAVVALAVTVAGSVTGGPSGHGPAAFAVSRLPGGKVAIRVVRTDVTAQQMTQQLHDQGLNITIDAVPASPQLVGRWLIVTASADVPPAVSDDLARQALGKTATLELTRTFPGKVTLTVGRAPRTGEDPQVSGIVNAAAPGGLLYCLQLSGVDAATAGQELADAGYTVRYRPGASLVRTVTQPPAGTRVVQAVIYDSVAPPGVTLDPHAVELVVRAPSDRLYDQLLWTGYPLSAADTGERDYSGCPAR